MKCLLLLLASAAAALASTPGHPALDTSALDAGGVRAASPSYQLTASLSPVAGTTASPSYTIEAGFDPSDPATPPRGGRLRLDPVGPIAAGADFEVSFPGWIDDHLPLSYRVEIDASPASPSGPDSTRRVVAPAQTGTYTLRGWITDARGSSTVIEQSLQVVTDQEAWRYRFFETIQDGGVLADDFDFDFDGRVNGIEWALLGDPTRPDATSVTAQPPTGESFSIEYDRRTAAAAAGYRFAVRWWDGDPPASWSDHGVTQQIVADDGRIQTVRAQVPLSPLGRRFARLEVSLPAAPLPASAAAAR